MDAVLLALAALFFSVVVGLTIGPWLFKVRCGGCAAAEGAANLHCARHGKRSWR